MTDRETPGSSSTIMESQHLFNRIALILLLSAVSFSACSTIFNTEPDSDPESVFEQVWNYFQDDYALFEVRNIDWAASYQQFRPKVDSGTSPSDLFRVLSEMLAPIGDGHIALFAPHHGLFTSNEYIRDRKKDLLFQPDLIRNEYLRPGFVSNSNSYIYGFIRDHNIAYLHIHEFRANSARFSDFISAYPDVDGYIVDMRHNTGGDVSHGFEFLSRFTSESRMFLKSRTKNGKGHNDYTNWFEWHITPSKTLIDRPLIVLTDRYTVSAAERFVLAAKSIDRAIVIGDYTNGTLGTKITRELSNGWYVAYSIQQVIAFDGVNYEGLGITPDIYIVNEIDSVLSGIDQVLESGIQAVYSGISE